MDFLYSFEFSSNKGRGKLWYIIALSVIIGLVIWGFLTRQYVMSFLIILISGISFFIDNNSPEKIIVNINNLGIYVNNNFYEFSKIQNYSFIYEGGSAVLLRMTMKKRGLKFIDLNVDNNITYELKQILPNFIQEDDSGELSFTEKLIRMLKL